MDVVICDNHINVSTTYIRLKNIRQIGVILSFFLVVVLVDDLLQDFFIKLPRLRWMISISNTQNINQQQPTEQESASKDVLPTEEMVERYISGRDQNILVQYTWYFFASIWKKKRGS